MISELSIQDRQQLIYQIEKKSFGMAYLLCLLGGFLGAHYFYLGEKKNIRRALWRLIPTLMIMGLPITIVLLVLDFFQLGKHVHAYNRMLMHNIFAGARSY